MKLTILSAVAVALFALIGASEAQAGPRYGGHRGHGYGGYHHQPSYHVDHCAPVYKTRTVEICRERQCRTAYRSCGAPYTYHVTVVTYRDYFSNGTSRTWNRVI